MAAPLSLSPSQSSWSRGSQSPDLSQVGLDKPVNRRRPRTESQQRFVQLSDDESDTEQAQAPIVTTKGKSPQTTTMHKEISSRRGKTVTQGQRTLWVGDSKAETTSEASGSEGQTFSLLPRSQTFAEGINWHQLSLPCRGTPRQKLPVALAAKERLMYLKQHHLYSQDVDSDTNSDIARVGTALHDHFSDCAASGVSTHSEYLTILCELHNESATGSSKITGIEFNSTAIEPDSLSLDQLKRLIPLYSSMTAGNQGKIRTAQERVAKKLILKACTLLTRHPEDLGTAHDVLLIIQKDLLPLLVIPVSPDTQGLLEKPILSVIDTCIAGTWKNKTPLFQQLQDLLSLALNNRWIKYEKSTALSQKLNLILNQPIAFGRITKRKVHCPSFSNPDHWVANQEIKLTYSKMRWNSIQEAFHGIDRVVMSGYYPSALANGCELWQRSLPFMTPQERMVLQSRLNGITRMLLAEMYSSIKQEPIPVVALHQQLEWLLYILGEDAWSSALSSQVKGALNYLAQTVIKLKLPETKQEPDIHQLIELLENTESTCYLAGFPLEEHLQKQIETMLAAGQLTPIQKKSLNHLLGIDVIDNYLTQHYFDAVKAMLQGNFSSVSAKVIKLKALDKMCQTASPVDLLKEAETIAGPTPRARKLDDTINRLRQRLVDLTCENASQMLKAGDTDGAETCLKKVVSLPRLSKYNQEQLESIQARTYLLQVDLQHSLSSIVPLLPDLQPLIHLLAPDLNALQMSSQDYFSDVVHRLASSSASAIPDKDAEKYCPALERLYNRSWGCVFGDLTLPSKIAKLLRKYQSKAEAYKQRQAISDQRSVTRKLV